MPEIGCKRDQRARFWENLPLRHDGLWSVPFVIAWAEFQPPIVLGVITANVAWNRHVINAAEPRRRMNMRGLMAALVHDNGPGVNTKTSGAKRGQMDDPKWCRATFAVRQPRARTRRLISSRHCFWCVTNHHYESRSGWRERAGHGPRISGSSTIAPSID